MVSPFLCFQWNTAYLFWTHQPLFLAKTTLCFLFLALALNARFFVKFTLFHFTKEPFLLKLTLEHAYSLLNVIINNLDFQEQSPHFPAICSSPSGLESERKITLSAKKKQDVNMRTRLQDQGRAAGMADVYRATARPPLTSRART